MEREAAKADHTPHVTYAVYYDGSCPVCTLTMDTIGKTSQSNAFVMHDVTREELPSHIDKVRAMEEIHVTSSDGITYTNADAVLILLSRYRGFGWVFRVGTLPGIRNILHTLYRFVARNRYQILSPMANLFWAKIVIVLACVLIIILFLLL